MSTAPAPRGIVGIAGSAGGLTSFHVILAALPQSFPIPILLLLHLEPRAPSLLVEILHRETRLVVRQAEEGAVPAPGTVYVAPPDRHLTVSRDRRIRLTQDPPLHFVRPAADALFHSLAEVYGSAAIGVLCSGAGKDGASGLRALRECGAATLVQDPASCRHAGMPEEAIRQGAAAAVLALNEIGPCLIALANSTDRSALPGV